MTLRKCKIFREFIQRFPSPLTGKVTHRWTINVHQLTNENVPMRLSDAVQLVELTFSTWVMDRPVILCKSIEMIITTVDKEYRFKKWSCWCLFARVSHVFNDHTVDVTILLIYQAAISRITHQPIVYVALDENLSAKFFPEWEVHGVVVCFI